MDPLELLYEVEGLPYFALPASLAQLYGGEIGFPPPRVVANFVATVDGVVAVPSLRGSNRVIAASSEPDRFVMGLLRACCDAVVIGSGTLAASPSSTWTPARAYPAAEAGYAQLRVQLGLPAIPELAVVSGRGALDIHHPALCERSVVLTTDAGLALLAGRLPESAAVVSLGSGAELAPAAIRAALAERGHRLILHEGGPHAIGPMFAAGLIDELFLTVSPLLAGRIASDPRLALVEGVDLLGADSAAARLLGARRGGDHLFLRYSFASARSE